MCVFQTITVLLVAKTLNYNNLYMRVLKVFILFSRLPQVSHNAFTSTTVHPFRLILTIWLTVEINTNFQFEKCYGRFCANVSSFSYKRIETKLMCGSTVIRLLKSSHFITCDTDKNTSCHFSLRKGKKSDALSLIEIYRKRHHDNGTNSQDKDFSSSFKGDNTCVDYYSNKRRVRLSIWLTHFPGQMRLISFVLATN